MDFEANEILVPVGLPGVLLLSGLAVPDDDSSTWSRLVPVWLPAEPAELSDVYPNYTLSL